MIDLEAELAVMMSETSSRCANELRRRPHVALETEAELARGFVEGARAQESPSSRDRREGGSQPWESVARN